LTGQTNNQYLTLFGLDFNHEINPPTQWDVNLNLLSSSNLSQFQYGGSYSKTPGPDFMGDDGDGHAPSNRHRMPITATSKRPGCSPT
jgi:hypothetical protein